MPGESPLEVDIDVLTKTVQALQNSERVLNDAMRAMAEIGGGSIGTRTLDDAADSFQRRWHFGVQRIGENSRITADGVQQCLTAYRDADASTAAALELVSGGLTGSDGEGAQR